MDNDQLLDIKSCEEVGSLLSSLGALYGKEDSKVQAVSRYLIDRIFLCEKIDDEEIRDDINLAFYALSEFHGHNTYIEKRILEEEESGVIERVLTMLCTMHGLDIPTLPAEVQAGNNDLDHLEQSLIDRTSPEKISQNFITRFGALADKGFDMELLCDHFKTIKAMDEIDVIVSAYHDLQDSFDGNPFTDALETHLLDLILHQNSPRQTSCALVSMRILFGFESDPFQKVRDHLLAMLLTPKDYPFPLAVLFFFYDKDHPIIQPLIEKTFAHLEQTVQNPREKSFPFMFVIHRYDMLGLDVNHKLVTTASDCFRSLLLHCTDKELLKEYCECLLGPNPIGMENRLKLTENHPLIQQAMAIRVHLEG